MTPAEQAERERLVAAVEQEIADHRGAGNPREMYAMCKCKVCRAIAALAAFDAAHKGEG